LKELFGIWKSDACGVLEYKYRKERAGGFEVSGVTRTEVL